MWRHFGGQRRQVAGEDFFGIAFQRSDALLIIGDGHLPNNMSTVENLCSQGTIRASWDSKDKPELDTTVFGLKIRQRWDDVLKEIQRMF